MYFAIDIGNTNSIISRYTNDNSIGAIENSIGKEITPNIVTFADGKCYIGEQAQKQRLSKNTSYSIYDDPINNSYKIDGNLNSDHILAIILKYLHNCIEKYSSINEVVLVTPCDLPNEQIKQLLNSSAAAGFNVLDVINEIHAAAIYYRWQLRQKIPQKQNVMIFNFGGSSMSASIVQIDSDDIEVLAHESNKSINGKEIDKHFPPKVLELFNIEYGIEKFNEKTSQDIEDQCKDVKIILSKQDAADVQINSIKVKVSRALLEQVLNEMEIKPKIKDLFEKVLSKSQMEKDNIDNVFMIGGCSNIPFVVQAVEECMGKKPLAPNPTYSCSYGAAIYCSGLKNKVSRYNVGLRIYEKGKRNILWMINKNDRIPCQSKSFRLRSAPEYKTFELKFFAGSENNESIPIFETKVSNLLEDEDGKAYLEVSLSYDGILFEAQTETKDGIIKYKFSNKFDQSRAEKLRSDIEELMTPH